MTNEQINELLLEIHRTPLLSMEEELELLEKIQAKGADCYEMQKLGKANLVYVVSLVRQYKNQGLELEELLEAGKEGLRRAALTYRSDSDIRFLRYAVGQMRQSILAAIELKK